MQPGGFDFGQLMASAQKMQADVERAQASLAEARVVGSAGGGLVRAEVDGSGELRSLTIDPSVVDPADVETLADLIVAAVHDGLRAANALTQEAMGSVAGGLLGGATLPGLGDLGGLVGGGPAAGVGGPPGLGDLAGLVGFAGLPGFGPAAGALGAGFDEDDDEFDDGDEFDDEDEDNEFDGDDEDDDDRDDQPPAVAPTGRG